VFTLLFSGHSIFDGEYVRSITLEAPGEYVLCSTLLHNCEQTGTKTHFIVDVIPRSHPAKGTTDEAYKRTTGTPVHTEYSEYSVHCRTQSPHSQLGILGILGVLQCNPIIATL
jgi:hypothetical protein